MCYANFTEVAGMVFVEVDAMMMLTTSVITTSRMFPMLANTAMTMGHITAKVPGLLAPILTADRLHMAHARASQGHTVPFSRPSGRHTV